MDIETIKGKSAYIKGGTNTGVYYFDDGTILLIDPGHSVNRGQRIAKMLKDKGLTPKYVITTHEHFDHFEAFAGLEKEYPDLKLLAHKLAKPYIENLYLGMAYMTSSSMPKFFGRRSNGVTGEELSVGGYKVDWELEEGSLEIGDKKIEILHTPGHCSGQMIVITPDRVCYLGDAVLDKSVIEAYDMPFLFDIKKHKQSLNKIKTLEIEYALIGHSKKVYDKAELIEVIDKNLEVLDRYERDILKILEEPSSREEILASLMQKNQVQCTYTTYHYNNSTVGAYLAKLSNEDLIDYEYRDGKIYYFRSN